MSRRGVRWLIALLATAVILILYGRCREQRRQRRLEDAAVRALEQGDRLEATLKKIEGTLEQETDR